MLMLWMYFLQANDQLPAMPEMPQRKHYRAKSPALACGPSHLADAGSIDVATESMPATMSTSCFLHRRSSDHRLLATSNGFHPSQKSVSAWCVVFFPSTSSMRQQLRMTTSIISSLRKLACHQFREIQEAARQPLREWRPSLAPAG